MSKEVAQHKTAAANYVVRPLCEMVGDRNMAALASDVESHWRHRLLTAKDTKFLRQHPHGQGL